MQADVTREWLELTALTPKDLEVALELAIDLRGRPQRWMWQESSGTSVYVRNTPEEYQHLTVPFPLFAEPSAKDLASQVWHRSNEGSADPSFMLGVRIPRYPVTWGDAFSAFMLTNDVVCVIILKPTAELEALVPSVATA